MRDRQLDDPGLAGRPAALVVRSVEFDLSPRKRSATGYQCMGMPGC